MDWYTGLLMLLAGVLIVLSRDEIRQERQQREDMLHRLDAVIGLNPESRR